MWVSLETEKGRVGKLNMQIFLYISLCVQTRRKTDQIGFKVEWKIWSSSSELQKATMPITIEAYLCTSEENGLRIANASFWEFWLEHL